MMFSENYYLFKDNNMQYCSMILFTSELIYMKQTADTVFHKYEIGGDKQTLKQAYSPKEVQVAFKILMTHLICVSHDVSHFAAFFIVVEAKRSVAESVLISLIILSTPEGIALLLVYVKKDFRLLVLFLLSRGQ